MGVLSWPAGPAVARRAPAQRLTAVVPPVVCGLAAAVAVLHWLDRGAHVATWWSGSVGLTTALGGFGALLVRRIPANPIGWLLVAGGVGQGLLGVGREWAVYATVTRGGDLPGSVWACWIGSWLFVVPIAAFPAILLLLPDGRLRGRRTRWLLGAIAGLTAMVCVAGALAPGVYTDELPTLRNPIGVPGLPAAQIIVAGQILLLATVALAFGAVVSRWTEASADERQQLKWLAFGGVLVAIDLTYALAPWHMPGSDVVWLPVLSVGLFLAAISVAVLRYRLWDIDVLIGASLVYGVLTVLLGGGYVAIVAVSGRVRSHPVDLSSSLLAAAVVAVAFAPLRAWLQHRLARRVHGDGRDPYRALTTVSDRLGGPSDDGATLAEVTTAIATSLRLARVEIRVAATGMIAATGTDRAATYTVPLPFRGALVGELAVAPRPSATLGPRERAVLQDLAPVLAAGVHAVTVSDELQASRSKLVTAREEERRRVRRDLHDGLGPTLAALRMRLESAALLIDSDPVAAREVLDDLSTHTADAIADLRRLVRGLRPPALDELGLASAIADLTAGFGGSTVSGCRLTIDVAAGEDIDLLPAAVEVAAFRIVSESVTNVVRHADATHCQVSIHVVGPGLHVVVDDDGVGIAPSAPRGVGLRSITERADELGGHCRVGRSPLGGTRVDAWIPVQP